MSILHFLLAALFPLGALSTVHEQRCYYDVGELAPADFLPCYGSPDQKAVPCCKRGSKCMEQGTCYDMETGVTYQYGCTDGSYQNGACPRKCGFDSSKSNWIGLVYCHNSWLCHHPDHCGKTCAPAPWDPLIKRPPPVKCSDMNPKYRPIVAPNPLQDLLFLPWKDDEVQSYLDAHPTTTSKRTSSRTSTAASPTSTSTEKEESSSSVSTTTTESKSSTDSSATSTASQTEATPTETEPTDTTTAPAAPTNLPKKHSPNAVAIGLGAGVPIVLALAGAALFFFLKRRRSKNEPPKPEISHLGPGSNTEEERYNGYRGWGADPGYAYKNQGPAMHELPSPEPRSELDGDERYMQSPMGSPPMGRYYPGHGHGQDYSERPASDVYSNEAPPMAAAGAAYAGHRRSPPAVDNRRPDIQHSRSVYPGHRDTHQSESVLDMPSPEVQTDRHRDIPRHGSTVQTMDMPSPEPVAAHRDTMSAHRPTLQTHSSSQSRSSYPGKTVYSPQESTTSSGSKSTVRNLRIPSSPPTVDTHRSSFPSSSIYSPQGGASPAGMPSPQTGEGRRASIPGSSIYSPQGGTSPVAEGYKGERMQSGRTEGTRRGSVTESSVCELPG